MNTNKLTFTAIAAMAVALAIAIAPVLSPNAYAVKTVQEEECEGDPQERPRCPGNSAEGNPHRVQEECEVTAGSNDHIVQGQQRKVCD
jgi:hypothetical protein